MGSKVQAELGNAAEESLTIAPCLQHCPGLDFPIMAVPECVPPPPPQLFREVFLVFPPMRSQMVPEAEMIPTESPLPSKGIPEVIFLLKLQQTGKNY